MPTSDLGLPPNRRIQCSYYTVMLGTAAAPPCAELPLRRCAWDYNLAVPRRAASAHLNCHDPALLFSEFVSELAKPPSHTRPPLQSCLGSLPLSPRRTWGRNNRYTNPKLTAMLALFCSRIVTPLTKWPQPRRTTAPSHVGLPPYLHAVGHGAKANFTPPRRRAWGSCCFGCITSLSRSGPPT